MSPRTPQASRAFDLQIFLVAFSVLLLEIGYTRVFSFKVSSYYTYLILGIALLGTGAGAVFAALSERLRTAPAERVLPALAVVGGVVTALGWFVVAGVELSTYGPPASFGQVVRLVTVCGALFASFLAAGLVVALLFSTHPDELGHLYAADLAGAGLGCAAALPMMLLLTPPGCVFASAAALAVSGAGPAKGRLRATSIGVATLLAIASGFASRLPDPVVDVAKTMGRIEMEKWGFESVFKRWHPIFRVDVLRSPLHPKGLALVHDGDWGSALWAWDGSDSGLQQIFRASSRAMPFAVANEHPRVLIIGAAGGHEILASRYFGASEVVAVELNPVTISLHLEHFKEYTGGIGTAPNVRLINAEGRAFLSRDTSRYDLIYFVAPDSYASQSSAQASGFVLVESYLYTEEMILEAMDHLTHRGVLCMQFGEVDYAKKPNRTTRYLATARSAFAQLGIRDFERHVLLATNVDFPISASTVILSREPFNADQQRAFRDSVAAVPASQIRHTPGMQGSTEGPNVVITLPDDRLEALYDIYPYEIRPVTDDAPFFWHFARFGDLLFGGNPALKHRVGPEDGRGETTLLVMLAVAGSLALLILMTPFLAIRRRWTQLPHKRPALVYFASLGLGFMFYEVCLIQKLTLFLGYPTYTLTVTLFALLLFSGVGSLLSERYAGHAERALPVLIGSLLALTVFYQFGLDLLISALAASALWLRIASTVVLLAPLGVCLGAFMPLGLGAVSRLTELRAEYVAWGWAVNAVFSVIASILGTMISMSYGFRVLLLISALLYLLAGTTLRLLLRAAPVSSARS